MAVAEIAVLISERNAENKIPLNDKVDAEDGWMPVDIVFYLFVAH